MKRLVFLTLLSFLLNGIGIAFGTEIRLGYVDLQRTLNESEDGKKAKSNLENLIKLKQVLINEKGKEIERLKEEIRKQSTLLSEDAMKSKQNELDRKMRDYQRFVQDAQEEVKKKEAEMTKEILTEIRDIVEEIGKKEKYTLIMEKAEGVVLYIDTTIDLTDKVIKKYNDRIKTKK